MKDLRKFIKTTIREFLNENITTEFTEKEKALIISVYRNSIFTKVRGTELYKKYNGGTIPYEYNENSWNILLNGIKESGIDIKSSLEYYIEKLKKTISEPIIDSKDMIKNFNPSTGEFPSGFSTDYEKNYTVNKINEEIKIIKKFIEYYKKYYK